MRTIILAITITIASPAYSQSEVSGICRVVDGDTVFAGSVEVRLQGVAAPEFNDYKKEPGGLQATEFLQQLCDGKQIWCELDGTCNRDRYVGICYLDGKDIGSEVIKAGLALDCTAFSGGRYKSIEQEDAKQRLPFPGYCGKKPRVSWCKQMPQSEQ